MIAPGLARIAALVLALEGIALTIVGALELGSFVAGGAAVASTGLALIVLTLLGAAGLFLFAGAVLRGAPWGRSGGIVLQLLAVAVALSMAGEQPFPAAFVWGVGAPGLIGFVLLLLSARREGTKDARVAGGAEDPPQED